MSNNDVAKVKSIADKILYKADMTPVGVIDELAELADSTPIDGSFGLLVKSIIFEVHTKLKS